MLLLSHLWYISYRRIHETQREPHTCCPYFQIVLESLCRLNDIVQEWEDYKAAEPYEYCLYGIVQSNLNKIHLYLFCLRYVYVISASAVHLQYFLHSISARISAHSMGWFSLFESTGSTHWCVGTKRIYLIHHFNNFQPARLVLSVLAEPCYQLDRLSRLTSSFHTIAHQTARYAISPKHHASTLTGRISVTAHTNTHTQVHMHRQIKSMATFLHIRKCCTVGGQWRSPPTHRIFNSLCTNSSSLYLTHACMGSTTFTHAPSGKYCLCVHTHTCRPNIETHTRTQKLTLCHIKTSHDLSHTEIF